MSNNNYCLFVLLLWICFSVSVQGSLQMTPVVQTSKGPVQGYSLNNTAVFLGIPFAAPPIVALRFMPPVPSPPWKNVLVTTKFGPWCMQPRPPPIPGSPNFTISEDCLYLNVFTPKINPAAKYPVMFWVPGGGFNIGTAMTYSPSSIISNLVSRGVVVVSTNYRLNAFGFFSTYSPLVRGNMGIRDQIAALAWTKSEISKFGGNPNQITVFGESAGSASTSILTLSPLSNGMISKAIIQSASAFNPWAVDGEGYAFSPASRYVALMANCTANRAWINSQIPPTLLKCLQNVPAQLLLTYAYQAIGHGAWWCPVLDGSGGVLPDWPSNLALKRPNSMQLLIGSTHDERAAFTVGIYGPLSVVNFNKTLFQTLVTSIMAPPTAYGSKAKAVANVISKAYTPTNPPLQPNDHWGWLKATVRAFSGFSFSAGLRKDIDMALKCGNPNVYVYSFDFISNTFPFPQNYKCAFHGEDLFYLFPGIWQMLWRSWQTFNMPRVPWTFDANDTAISKQFGITWTTFAKTGNLRNLGMMPVSKTNPTQYYSINVPSKMMNYYHNLSANIWNNIIPSIMGGPPTKHPIVTPTTKPGLTLMVLLQSFDNTAGGGMLFQKGNCDPFWFTGLDQCDMAVKICIEPMNTNSNKLSCAANWIDLGKLSNNTNKITFNSGAAYGGWTNPMQFGAKPFIAAKGVHVKYMVEDVDNGGRQLIDINSCNVTLSKQSHGGTVNCKHMRPSGYPTLYVSWNYAQQRM